MNEGQERCLHGKKRNVDSRRESKMLTTERIHEHKEELKRIWAIVITKSCSENVISRSLQ